MKGGCQNLVPNPSFEDTVSCPDNFNQVARCLGWSVSKDSPDYFHSCDTQGFGVSIPLNAFGYQQAATGNAYCGFYTFNSPATYREIIGTQLTSALNIAEKYYISFKVSLGDPVFNLLDCASNKIGALFSTVPYSLANPAPINNFSHVYSASVIVDSINWVTISGSFVADSAYQYIHLGCFFEYFGFSG